MKINYKKGSIIIALVDLVLLGLIIVGGYRILAQFNPNLISSENKTGDMVKESAAIISLQIPGVVNAGQEFSLVMQIHNPNPAPILYSRGHSAPSCRG